MITGTLRKRSEKILILTTLFLSMAFSPASPQGLGLTSDLNVIDTVPANNSGTVFERITIDNVRSESCAFSDVNNDGAVDIATHDHWYEGPDFETKHRFRDMEGQMSDGCCAGLLGRDDFLDAVDFNDDGWQDFLAVGHHKDLRVYFNPGDEGTQPWEFQVLDDVRDAVGFITPEWSQYSWAEAYVNYHNGVLMDIDGDGIRAELITSGGCMPQYWAEIVEGEYIKHKIGDYRCHQWGSGAGDINGDGRIDILRPEAWYEAPLDPRDGVWIIHMVELLPVDWPGPGTSDYSTIENAQHMANMYAYDVNDDGLNDILASSGHGWGLFWYEQVRDSQGNITFTRHTIDQTVDNGHNLELEDFNNDGVPDLLMGRRQADADSVDNIPNFVYWYELTPGAENPWTRHVISYNEQIGIGTKAGVMDIDDDGDLDLVVNSADGGPHLFINQTDPVSIAQRPEKTRRQSLKAVFAGGSILLMPSGSPGDAPGALRDIRGRRVLPELFPFMAKFQNSEKY